MELQYFGRKKLASALMDGWSPIEGHDYAPGEYLFVLARGDMDRSLEEARVIIQQIATTVRTGATKQRNQPARISASTKDRVVWRLKRGYSQNSISKQFGIARRTVRKIKVEEGIW